MLHQHFVSQALFDEKQAAFFSKLMQKRIDDDYSDFVVIEFDEVREFVEPAKDYIHYIEQLIEK
jgi:uncharacterized protein (UPF0332 family)